MGYAIGVPDVGATNVVRFINSQVAGAAIADKVAAWKTAVQAARCCYFGVTVFADVPTLNDQGTTACGQLQQSWTETYAAGLFSDVYNGPPVDSTNIMNQPAAVQWRAKDGVYMPLRLSTPTFPFIAQADSVQYTGPYVGITTDTITRALSTQMGVLTFTNLSIHSQLRFVVRMGVEVSCNAGSAYTPFQKLPLAPDSKALDAYFAISANSPDAYGSLWNDWDLLFGALKKIAAKVLTNPVLTAGLSALGPLGTGLNVGRAALAGLLNKSKKPSNGSKPVLPPPSDKGVATGSGLNVGRLPPLVALPPRPRTTRRAARPKPTGSGTALRLRGGVETVVPLKGGGSLRITRPKGV